jgi:phenylalanyl-tRNA synthetase alpha subunit
MARSKTSILNDLSTADLKRLLAARERIDVLERERAKLAADLARVEKELAQLMANAADGGRPKRKARAAGAKKAGRGRTAVRRKAKTATVKKAAAKKKTASKKAATKKAATKKAATKKAATRKTTAKKTTAKKTTAKKTSAKKTAARKTAAKPRKTLEDVVVQVLKKNGGTMPFQDLKGAIVKGRLFTSRSTNFDNVLRRTLSTSKAVKRAGRGIYKVA